MHVGPCRSRNSFSTQMHIAGWNVPSCLRQGKGEKMPGVSCLGEGKPKMNHFCDFFSFFFL